MDGPRCSIAIALFQSIARVNKQTKCAVGSSRMTTTPCESLMQIQECMSALYSTDWRSLRTTGCADEAATPATSAPYSTVRTALSVGIHSLRAFASLQSTKPCHLYIDNTEQRHWCHKAISKSPPHNKKKGVRCHLCWAFSMLRRPMANAGTQIFERTLLVGELPKWSRRRGCQYHSWHKHTKHVASCVSMLSFEISWVLFVESTPLLRTNPGCSFAISDVQIVGVSYPKLQFLPVIETRVVSTIVTLRCWYIRMQTQVHCWLDGNTIKGNTEQNKSEHVGLWNVHAHRALTHDRLKAISWFHGWGWTLCSSPHSPALPRFALAYTTPGMHKQALLFKLLNENPTDDSSQRKQLNDEWFHLRKEMNVLDVGANYLAQGYQPA